MTSSENTVDAPLISIGLAVYNGENFLRQAVDSVLSQTFTDFELVICDNASTDTTPEICQEYVERDPRVRYFRNASNLGVSPNHNRAFRESTGKFFKWITHDDEIAPDCLEKTLAALRADADAILCHSKVHLIDAAGDTIEYYDTGMNSLGDPRQSVRFGELICKPNQCLECDGLMRREALEQMQLYRSFPGADRALLTELGLIGRMIRLEEPVFLTREHDTRFRRAETTPQDRLATYDSSRRGEKVVGTWELYRDYCRMVREHVIDTREKRACYGHLFRWWFVNWNSARLVVDIISIAFPSFLWRAEQFKQRYFSPEPGPNVKARDSGD